MGKNISKYMPKYVRDFNIENRTHKYIEKKSEHVHTSDINPAPRHASTKKILEEIEKSAPTNINTLEVNKRVNEMMKQVKVVSQGVNLDLKTKQLPQYQEITEKYLYGYREPDKLKHGKISLKLFNEMIKENQELKSDDTQRLDKLSSKYKLDKDLVDNLLLYYKPFQAFTSKDFEKTRGDETKAPETASSQNKNLNILTQSEESIFIKTNELLNAPTTTKPNKL